MGLISSKLAGKAHKTTKGKPKDLGPRGKSEKGYTATKPKATVKTNSYPNSNAIVSRTTDTSGKMDNVQKKNAVARTKRAMRANLKGTARSAEDVGKVMRKFPGALKKAMKGLTRGAMAMSGPAMTVADDHKRSEAASERKARRIKDA